MLVLQLSFSSSSSKVVLMWLRKCGQVVGLSSIGWLGEEAVFEFEWREVAQSRMEAQRIIEGLDVVKEQGLSVL